MSKIQEFKDADKAVAAIEKVYDESVKTLTVAFEGFTKGKKIKERVRAYYPYLRIKTTTRPENDGLLSYGFVTSPGTYEATLTRPELFGSYYKNQIQHLLDAHGVAVEVGISNVPIPVHFALGEDYHLEGDLSVEQIKQLPNIFDQPDLEIMDDQIANCAYQPKEGQPSPLALFTAPRVDLSLLRLKHYTGTKANNFQNFIIFTNYQFYIDEFVKIGQGLVGKDGYTDFIQPDLTSRIPQMPAYHLRRSDNLGITMINIGVGPSNAKNITDHVAVLRPHAWIMLGHCAGLRNSQELGDYVLAHAYLREDNILYHDLNPSIPVPALAEVQVALEDAVKEETKCSGRELKKVMRTGTVATVDDRNWELKASIRQNRRFSQSRAIALDMESGTIAANGFRFRVPYGTLLCVSDKPLHGQVKLPGMADNFYRQRVEQHLKVGLRAMEILRDTGPEKLHSRKLRSFNEVAFQ